MDLAEPVRLDDSVDAVKDRIAAAYEFLGYHAGWTFMMAPERNLYTSPIALVGLNPGGGGPNDHFPYKGIWDCPNGNDYVSGDWRLEGYVKGNAPLQRQVKSLLKALSIDPEAAFCAQFVPFRSQTWCVLNRSEAAVSFSESLWRWTLQRSPATLFVTLGHVTSSYLSTLLSEGTSVEETCHNCDWGQQKIKRLDFGSGKTIVSLPHLSRYRLFGSSLDESRSVRIANRAALVKDLLDSAKSTALLT